MASLREVPPATRRRGHPPHGPHWLLGDWSGPIRDPIDLIRLSFLVGAVATALAGEWEQALRLSLTFAVTLVARALDLPRPFDLAFNIGMAFQAWGNVAGAFDDVYGYDKLVHFVLPGAMAALIYIVSIRLRLLPDLAGESGLHQRLGIVLIAFSLGMTVGAFYEMYEWFAVHALSANLRVGYGDTIGDLLDDAVGALAGGLGLVLWDMRGWGTRRRLPGELVGD